MRPKRQILLIDSNEMRLSTRSYMLQVRGFNVHAAATAEEATVIVDNFSLDLVIGCWPLPGGNPALLDALRGRYPGGVPTMLLAEQLTTGPESAFADAILLKPVSAAEIVDRAKTLCARKRGPKKFQPVSVGADLAMRRTA